MKEYQKYMKDKQFKSFVDKYASDYAKYLKDGYLTDLRQLRSCWNASSWVRFESPRRCE